MICSVFWRNIRKTLSLKTTNLVDLLLDILLEIKDLGVEDIIAVLQELSSARGAVLLETDLGHIVDEALDINLLLGFRLGELGALLRQHRL